MQKLILPLLLILFLSACSENDAKADFIVEHFEFSEGAFYPGNIISASASFYNDTKEDTTVWCELNIINRYGEQKGFSSEKSIVSAEKELLQNVSWAIPPDILNGNYHMTLVIRKKDSEKGIITLAEHCSQKDILIYKTEEDFEQELDDTIWTSSDKLLGRTLFKSCKVSTVNGILNIKMPSNSFDGGEIFSKELQSFGAFEARMKLPNAPSSITGFFLYRPPDYYYEIDIEIFNQTDAPVFFTTYADGKKRNQYNYNLNFDPTEDFHNYRIEYYEDMVDFYIDDQHIIGWPNGYPKEKMYLMVNTWYPNWLPGEKVKEDQYLSIDWIRY